MYKHLASPEELNVKPGDVVSVMGNVGTVSDVIDANNNLCVRVHFLGHLAKYGQYQDKIYAGFKVIKGGGETE